MSEVSLSTDPGSYYCSHVFFLAQRHARERGLAGGAEPRVGFLHIPRDAWLDGRGGYDPATRHRALVDVLSRALRGLADGISGRARLLVTGFGAFDDVVDNPTGDLVTRPELTLAVCRAAFGDARAGADDVVEAESAVVTFAHLPVDDRALAPAAAESIQAAMDRARPDAVLMMGVGHEGFLVETEAHDRGLEWSGDAPRHAPESTESERLEANLTLARALGLA